MTTLMMNTCTAAIMHGYREKGVGVKRIVRAIPPIAIRNTALFVFKTGCR
jgi:hypothetical protein